MKPTFLLLVLVSGVSSIGCVSPEATRTRGGGPGADVGNRSEVVRMHEGSKQFYETPTLIPAQPPPLGPAQHAYQTSRP